MWLMASPQTASVAVVGAGGSGSEGSSGTSTGVSSGSARTSSGAAAGGAWTPPDGTWQALGLRSQDSLYGRNALYYHTGSAYGVFNCMSYDPETRDGVVAPLITRT